jgi:thiol-disulfide isomerase/thioredoxin
MKRIIVVSALLFLLVGFLGAESLMAQSTTQWYETLPDAEEKKILKGFITKQQITNDTTFAWYAINRKYNKPNPDVVAVIKEKAYEFQLVFFIGTWCHDSQQILPKYFAALEAAEYPEHYMTIIACDRDKAGPANIQRPFKVVNVPTVLVMKDGKEVGRIVEFGNTGMVDQELAEIVKKL